MPTAAFQVLLRFVRDGLAMNRGGATALMVSGDDGANWFGREELDGYSAWVIERNEGGAWGVGSLITAR